MPGDREDEVRKTDQIISKLIEMWPVWVALATGLVGGINLWNTVKGLADDQKSWKATLDQRKEANRTEMENIRTRLTVLETKNDSKCN